MTNTTPTQALADLTAGAEKLGLYEAVWVNFYDGEPTSVKPTQRDAEAYRSNMNAKYPHDQDKRTVLKMVPALSTTQAAQPATAPNLACKSVQARLAEQWGYVRAQPDMVPVPMRVLECAATALGNFVSDHGWSDEDMQAMDNLDAFIAQHHARMSHGITAHKGGKAGAA